MDAFLVSTAAVALSEIGDKTQIAKVALAAKYQDIVTVTLGTTLGMMAANAPDPFRRRRDFRCSGRRRAAACWRVRVVWNPE